MGTDKASLPYRGLTLLEHMRGIAKHTGAEAVLVGGGLRGDFSDPIAGAGPVASLVALARHISEDGPPSRWVAIPVDMPLLNGDLLRRLAAGARATFFAGHPLPLALTLDSPTRDVLRHMGERLRAGESVSVRRVLDLIGADALVADQNEKARLVNANTPQEWEEMIGRSESPNS
jgi:molybdopterin-guanine dinucleotide biosynthesis protein A